MHEHLSSTEMFYWANKTLSRDINYQFLTKKQIKQLITSSFEFALRCYKKWIIFSNIKKCLDYYKYELIESNYHYHNPNHIIRAFMNKTNYKRNVIIYLEQVQQLYIKIGLVKKCCYLDVWNLILFHECFHIIEEEEYFDYLIKSNKIENPNSKNKIAFYALSEISANYFAWLASKKKYYLDVFDNI